VQSGTEPPPPKALPGMQGDPNPPDIPPGGNPPPGVNIRGRWIQEHKVYKCGLHKMINTPPLENTINNVVSQSTRVCYQVSRVLQLHLQRVIENNLPFPDILNVTFIRRLFMLVQGRPANQGTTDGTYHDLVETYNTIYLPVVGTYALNRENSPSQVIAYLAQNYTVNIQQHIIIHFELMNKQWIKQSLIIRGLPLADAKQLSHEIWNFCSDEDQGHDQDQEEDASFYEEWRFFIDPIRASNTNVPAKIERMFHLNILFTAWASKLSSLVPIYTHDAKYIRIDTISLFEMLGRTRATGLQREEFQIQRQEIFRTHFNLPSRLFSNNDRIPHFSYMIDTDGVGASVHVFRWKWILIRENESNAARQERLANAREERLNTLYEGIQERADQQNLTWIGVDPGRKNVVTAAELDDENDHWSFKLTAKEYHHRIKANERKQQKEACFRRAGVLDWLQESPTMKTHSAGASLECIRRTFATNHLSRVFAVTNSRQAKHLRWRVHIHRMKTLDQVCRAIAGDNPRNTIVGYGSGSFNPSSPGHKPTPTRDRYIKNRLKYVHRLTVLDVWEFNTSQICSCCFAPVKLCGVATRQDPFMTPANIITNHHFVRRCTNPRCRTIWQRDVNAARNIAYLALHMAYQVDRPDPFKVSVPQPPHVHVHDVVEAAASA
jgi:hypothetical protein